MSSDKSVKDKDVIIEEENESDEVADNPAPEEGTEEAPVAPEDPPVEDQVENIPQTERAEQLNELEENAIQEADGNVEEAPADIASGIASERSQPDMQESSGGGLSGSVSDYTRTDQDITDSNQEAKSTEAAEELEGKKFSSSINPLYAVPPKAILSEEGQFEVSGSPAFQCLDELFHAGKLTGTKVSFLKAKYTELHDMLRR